MNIQDELIQTACEHLTLKAVAEQYAMLAQETVRDDHSYINYNIGRVLDELELLGLSSSTIVIYTSDHGEMMGEHGA